jgi:hypothetical protein
MMIKLVLPDIKRKMPLNNNIIVQQDDDDVVAGPGLTVRGEEEKNRAVVAFFCRYCCFSFL